MSFIANAPPTAGGGNVPLPEIGTIENDGWYPDIVLQHAREAVRLDGTVTTPRLTEALVAAVLHVNGELRDWKREQIGAGFLSLAAVPADRINRESELITHYRRAVYCTAKADLIERYRDYDSTASSLSDKKTMEALDQAPIDQRRNAHWAIADILGRTHVTVELI
ncbi:Phage head completion-stabilization protein [Collimonas arenae]|uniref:Phage head completion-stabilization protein n=1 Tax=Collimonas arenae TaxID=279058 RepID=A0A0A1FJA3_9BURK|nr:head completion/stabilization protein [Collimonas arenae]AIY42982.1 Phage head completion-stabilization protein [Collimonas arenae]